MEDVVFKNLTYTVSTNKKSFGSRKEKLVILKGVSGCFRHGQLSAILGSSGAGKSSLLNVISGLRTADVDGQIRCNRRRSCYITQENLHQPFLTVEEAISFSVQLKLGPSTQASVHTIIDKVLKNLNLSHRRALTADKLSGGERKRLSLALEYVSNPLIFFLDEPTSGLDEVTAVQTVKLLKKLAMQNHTVVCTIHQPSAVIFDTFDHIYVVAQGQCTYQGTPKALIPFLNTIGISCPTYYNPADFIIELLEIDINRENNVRISVNTIQNGSRTCDITKAAEFSCQPFDGCADNDTHDKLCENVSEFYQFIVLLRMMMLKIYRNKITFYLQLTHYIVCGLVFGFVFLQVGNQGNRMFDNVKICWGIIMCFIYTQYMIPVISYPLEIKLVKQEYLNRWYGLVPYYFAFCLSRIPLNLFASILFSALVYLLCGFPWEVARFINFVTVGFITGLTAEGFGLFVGATFSLANGTAVGPIFCIPLMVMGTYGVGFSRQITPFMKNFLQLSFVRTGFDAMILTVLGNGREKMDCPEMFCYFEDPKSILRYLDMQEYVLKDSVLIMIAYLVLFRILFFISLKYKFSS